MGAPFDIYSRPESLFVAGFIGSANLLPGTIASSDGGSTRVDLAGGAQVVVPAGNSADNVSLSAGTQVTVMIRPEQLSLGGAEGLSIDVTDTVFQGATLRLVGRMVNGTEVSAVLPVDPQRVTPAPGDSVTLSWHQSAPYLLDGWPDNAGSTTTNVDSIEAAL